VQACLVLRVIYSKRIEVNGTTKAGSIVSALLSRVAFDCDFICPDLESSARFARPEPRELLQKGPTGDKLAPET
jgi:hypothetical protein